MVKKQKSEYVDSCQVGTEVAYMFSTRSKGLAMLVVFTTVMLSHAAGTKPRLLNKALKRVVYVKVPRPIATDHSMFPIQFRRFGTRFCCTPHAISISSDIRRAGRLSIT